MRKKLLLFFLIIMIMGVSVTSLLSYKASKSILIENQKSSLRSEAILVGEYLKTYAGIRDNFDEFAVGIREKTGRRVTVMDEYGRVIGESEKPSSYMENHITRAEVKEALEKGEGSSIRLSDTQGKSIFYYAVKDRIGNKVYIVRLSMEFKAIELLQKKYMNFLILSIIIGIIVSTGLAFFYLDIFTMPIRDLTRLATTIALGQYEKRVNINSRDEIGQLGHSFNLMAARLEETITDLSDKRNKLISILTSMDDGVVVVDENERILIINPAAQRLFGIKEENTGKHLLEAVRNNDLEEIIKNIPDDEVEITISHPSIKHLRIKSTRVINYDRENGNLGVLLVINDITKIKKLEQMRSDFVANVSHELKTPLTSIKGFAETLLYVDDRETREKFLNIINIESERLTRLINDILTLSELENRDTLVTTEKINISNSIDEVLHIMQPLAKGKSISLEFLHSGNNIFILGDRDKFKQMIINLVDNGIKYTQSGGRVDVKISNNLNSAVITISDNGVGIPEDHIPRLFERFYRADKARSRYLGGTGLGLAIVKHIVMLLKGDISVRSKVGKGTIFEITLPLAK